MKKALAIMPLLVLLTAATWGASTPTGTMTYTNTYTRTPTHTPTVTRTPTPQAARDQRMKRDYFGVKDVRTSNSISSLATTPVANGIYAAQNQNMATIAIAVATPGAEPQFRLKWTVPADYEQKPGGLSVWLTGVNSTAITTTSMACNIYQMRRSGTNANYMNVQTMLGVTLNVNTLPNSYRLSQTTVTAKRFYLTMPTGVSQCAVGDELEFEIARTAGTGVLTLYTVEVEYNKKNFVNP